MYWNGEIGYDGGGNGGGEEMGGGDEGLWILLYDRHPEKNVSQRAKMD